MWMFPLRSEASSFWEKQNSQLFFVSYLLIITEIAGMHDPGIRLNPERVHQEHHRLLSVVPPRLDATHTPYGWGHWGASNTRRAPSGGFTLCSNEPNSWGWEGKKKNERIWVTENVGLSVLMNLLTVNWFKKEQKLHGELTIRGL